MDRSFKIMIFESMPASQEEAKKLPNSVMMAVPHDPDEFLAMAEARKLIGPCRLITYITVGPGERNGYEPNMYRPFLG